MKLSEHLDLAEVIKSDSAKRKGISNMPTQEHLENFKKLAENVFEPIRKHFAVPIHISSGYRSKELNALIGGVSRSQHCSGEAIDIDMEGSAYGVTNRMVFEFIRTNLFFDQLIAEGKEGNDLAWVHVSWESTGKQRKEVLIATKEKGVMKYHPYSLKLFQKIFGM